MKKKRGNPRLDDVRNTDLSAANEERQRQADELAEQIANLLRDAMDEYGGGRSMQFYADCLNEQGHRTAWGKLWTRKQVRRVLARLSEKKRTLKRQPMPD